MDKRMFKNRVYNELAKISKAMANPHRLEIIELLGQGEFSVEQIASQTNLPIANASQHLQILRMTQLVEITRRGNYIFYRLAHNNVFKAFKAIRDLGMERTSAIEKIIKDFRKSNFKLMSVTINELLEKIDSGKVTILDVRPESEFKKGHIAHAISIPIDQLSKRWKELPRWKEIITYCRGPFCVFADEAITILKQAGFKVRRLEEGFPDWKLKELPIEVSLN